MKKLVFLFSLLLQTICYSQMVCLIPGSPNPPANPLPSFLCPNIGNYFPFNYSNNPQDVTDVPVNFIYIKPLTGTGYWDACTHDSSIKVLNMINKWLDSLHMPSHPLPAPYTAAYHSSAKINFVHKATYSIADSSYLDFGYSDYQRLIPDTN